MVQTTTFISRLKLGSRVSLSEMLASAGAATIALALVAWISKQSLSGSNLPFILASMGATAVILFAAPTSTMGRPWPLLAGHLLAAFIGISCGKLTGNLLISVPLTIGLTIFAMHYLRCIHPPGGATALLTLLGGAEVSAAGYQFLLTPLAINLGILMLAAFILNKIRAEQGRKSRIEIPSAWQRRRQIAPTQGSSIDPQDLQAAIDELDSYVDLDAAQLAQLFDMAQRQHHSRKLGDMSCAEIMDPNPLALQYGDALDQAWHALSPHDEQAIIVINRVGHVEGIVTVTDFIEQARGFAGATEQERILALITPTTTLTSDKPETVGQIMTATTICISQDHSAADAWPMFEQYHIHHLPVIDENDKLVGIINRSTLAQILLAD